MTKTANGDGWRNRIVGEGEVPAVELVPHPQNWRKHPKEQGVLLTGTLDGVGWVQRVIVNKRSGRMLDGHLRAELARRQGEQTLVPVVYVDLSDDEERTVLATIDPIAGMAIANEEMLAGLVRSIEDADLRSVAGTIAQTLNVDVNGAGDAGKDTEPQIDRAEELRAKWGVEPGQLWQLGEHRLICGDCTDAAVVARVMGGERAQACVTDPPYGMYLDTDFSGMESKLFKGKTGGAGYAPVIGDDQDYDPSPMLALWDAQEVFLWGADYYAERLPLKNSGSWLVWDKRLDDSADKMYGSCFELCWSKRAHKRNIIRVKWAGIFGMETEDTQSRVHPTQKPIGVLAWIHERYTDRGAIIADPYLGSGTTLIACENLGRRCRAVEIAPGYVAVALERWAVHTGKTPVLLNE